MSGKKIHLSTLPGDALHIAPATSIYGTPEVPSSKYYTLRYVLAAMIAQGESRVVSPACSDDTDALLRACLAFGADIWWEDEPQRVLGVRGIARPYHREAVTINVGNAGAVLRLLLGFGALFPEVTFITDYPQSLGKRPNRELLAALVTLGAQCEAAGPEGYLPITLHGGNLHGGSVSISGVRSSQYLSSLLYLAPLLDQTLEITVLDGLKSQPLVRATLEVLHEAGIVVAHDESFHHFVVAAGQAYQPRTYVVPGDYPSAAALLAACVVMHDPRSELSFTRLRTGDEVGEALLAAFRAMGADLQRDGETLVVRGGHHLHGITLDGDPLIDCIPVLVAAACFAEGQSCFYNIESLHYKESDRINDLCAELQRAGCHVSPQQDAIIVQGCPQGIEGGIMADGHGDHRVLMALAIAGLGSRLGLTLTGVEHISKSYPYFFSQLHNLGITISNV